MSVNYFEVDVAERESVPGALDSLLDARGVAGVTEDGRLVALLQVLTDTWAPTAKDTPWWAELQAVIAEDPHIDPAVEIGIFVSAIPEKSGFAQVIRARVTDRHSFQRMLAADAEWLARERPEILGGALAWHGRDRFTLVVCFTDEASARAGEAKNADSPGADIDQLMHGVNYDELRDPWTRPLLPVRGMTDRANRE